MFPVRRFDTDFDTLPRHWYGGDPFLTHAVNGLNLVFPDGERFFIRSVRRYLDRITDPALRQAVQDFSGQEGQHGAAHEQQFRALERQGFEIASWLAWYRRVAFGRIEPMTPPRLRLAVTAALEHFTATFATWALETGHLDRADPAMRDLLRWHAAEEIEHRAVAYDVYVQTGGGYVVRVLGLFVATGVLLWFWNSARRHLLRQEPETLRQNAPRTLARERLTDRRALVRRAFLAYLRPGFHPDQVDDGTAAATYLASVGRQYS